MLSMGKVRLQKVMVKKLTGKRGWMQGYKWNVKWKEKVLFKMCTSIKKKRRHNNTGRKSTFLNLGQTPEVCGGRCTVVKEPPHTCFQGMNDNC